MILCDSNIFLIDRFFKRDAHYATNRRFVEKMPALDAGLAVYSLFEICGLASFNLSPEELEQWFYHFDDLYQVRVVYPKGLEQTLEQYFESLAPELFRMFGKRMTFTDAQILLLAEEHNATHLVTWNKRDFEGRTSIQVVTPEEFLAERD